MMPNLQTVSASVGANGKAGKISDNTTSRCKRCSQIGKILVLIPCIILISSCENLNPLNEAGTYMQDRVPLNVVLTEQSATVK